MLDPFIRGLTTERLVLRNFCEGDAEALFAVESDPQVAEYQSFEPRSMLDAGGFVEDAAASATWAPRTVYELAIVPRGEERLIGRVGLGVRGAHGGHGGQGELWYTMRRDRWGRGYATEAARAVLASAFGDIGLHRVHADCDPANVRSWRLLERLGMRREAHHVEWLWSKGSWVDSYEYAVLRREWRG